MRCWPKALSFACLILAAVQAAAVQGSLQISATSLDFGVGVVGQSPGPPTFPNPACCSGGSVHITNNGNATVNFSSFSITTSDFLINIGATLPQPPPTSVAPGVSFDVGMDFVPKSAGSLTAKLVIVDDAPGSPHQITLTGMGIGNNDFGISHFNTNNGAGTSENTSMTVTAGQIAAFPIDLAAGSGFTGGITLACSTLPAGAVCQGPPQPIMLTGPVLNNFKLNVATTAATAARGLHPVWWWASFFAVAGLIAMGRRNRCYHPFLLAMMLFLACIAMVSCGSGGRGGGGGGHTATPPGTYNFTLTASNGSTTRNTQLTLIVK